MPNIKVSNIRCKRNSRTFDTVNFRKKLSLQKERRIGIWGGGGGGVQKKKKLYLRTFTTRPSAYCIHGSLIADTAFFYFSLFDFWCSTWNLIRCKAFAVFPVNLVGICCWYLRFHFYSYFRCRHTPGGGSSLAGWHTSTSHTLLYIF